MTEKKSNSELFQAETEKSRYAHKFLATENSPAKQGHEEALQGHAGPEETSQTLPERPRPGSLIPGYDRDRQVKERKILTLRDILYIFFKHLRSITIVTAVCVVTAALYAFSVTPLYLAETKMLVRIGREKLSNVAEYSRNVSLFYPERNQDVNNELEIFKSDELSRMVYEDLKSYFDREEANANKNVLSYIFTRLKKGLSKSELSQEEKTIIFLKRSLKVEFLAETDILRLSFEHPDPEFSALAANTYANAFIRLRTKIYETTKSHAFYIDQISLAKKTVDDLTEEQKNFSRKWQIAEVEKEKELILQQREKLITERLAAQQDYDRCQALLASVQKMFNNPEDWVETPKMSEHEMVDRQGYLADVDRQYFTLKLERSRLSEHFTDKAREVQQLDANIAHLRKQKYLSLVNILELNRNAIEPLIKKLDGEIDKKSQRLNELIQAAYILEQFKLKKEVAVTTFLNYSKRAEDLRINDDLDKRQITSINMINTATAPMQPDFPKKGLILLTATFFGIFLSFGLSAVKEFFTHVFRDGQDVERILEIPLLMSISHREKF